MKYINERELQKAFVEKCREEFYNVAIDDFSVFNKSLDEISQNAYSRENAILLAYSYFCDYQKLVQDMQEIHKITRTFCG